MRRRLARLLSAVIGWLCRVHDWLTREEREQQRERFVSDVFTALRDAGFEVVRDDEPGPEVTYEAEDADAAVARTWMVPGGDA